MTTMPDVIHHDLVRLKSLSSLSETPWDLSLHTLQIPHSQLQLLSNPPSCSSINSSCFSSFHQNKQYELTEKHRGKWLSFAIN
jgi:hypothetical protein